MSLSVVKLQFLKITIVDKLEVGAVDVTELTFEMRTHPKVDFEGLKVIKSSITKLAKRMIQDQFSCFAKLSFSKMPLNFMVTV